MREKITVNAYDDWRCLCNNTATTNGFYPCDENGDEVSPTEQEWQTNWYVCLRCGRVIDAGRAVMKHRVREVDEHERCAKTRKERQ